MSLHLVLQLVEQYEGGQGKACTLWALEKNVSNMKLLKTDDHKVVEFSPPYSPCLLLLSTV